VVGGCRVSLMKWRVVKGWQHGLIDEMKTGGTRLEEPQMDELAGN
jgi:hypothetical protein